MTPPSFVRASNSAGGSVFSILVDGRHVGTVAEAATSAEAVAAWEMVHGPQRLIEAKLQSLTEAARQPPPLTSR